MAFADTYLGRLRQRIGSDLVLMPGAMVLLERANGQVLMTRRGDNGEWCFPAGSAEEGGSFAATAIDEVREEVGIELDPDELEAFGSLSSAADHVVRYPSGDVVHCFALLLTVKRPSFDVEVDGEEAIESRFVELDDLPDPAMHPAVRAAELLLAYRAGHGFQVG